MNQKCSVCKEPAAGYHFGAFTCEGCKSFFGRTYSNPGSVSECKNGGNCEINKKNRTSCKACRLKKCILAGMSKSSSRYGRRSNLFKASYTSSYKQEDKQSKKPYAIPPFHRLYPSLLSRSCIGFDDESDTSTAQKISADRCQNVDDTVNSHNNELLLHNWCVKFKPQLSITPLSTSNQITSLPMDNQIQQQSPMQYTMPFLPEPYQSLILESQSRNTSDSNCSDDEPDAEYKNSWSEISPFTFTNKIDEPTLSNSVSINGSLTLMEAHNPHLNSLYSIPGMITPTAYSARGGDSLLVSPNPGGLADELDKPIDLSIRASSSSSQSNESLEKKKREEKEEDQTNDSDSSSTEEDCAAKPLDLTLDATPLVKSLRSTSRS